MYIIYIYRVIKRDVMIMLVDVEYAANFAMLSTDLSFNSPCVTSLL